jgi:hypothetical protein
MVFNTDVSVSTGIFVLAKVVLILFVFTVREGEPRIIYLIKSYEMSPIKHYTSETVRQF